MRCSKPHVLARRVSGHTEFTTISKASPLVARSKNTGSCLGLDRKNPPWINCPRWMGGSLINVVEKFQNGLSAYCSPAYLINFLSIHQIFKTCSTDPIELTKFTGNYWENQQNYLKKLIKIANLLRL